jgi:hypothetical protein
MAFSGASECALHHSMATPWIPKVAVMSENLFYCLDNLDGSGININFAMQRLNKMVLKSSCFVKICMPTKKERRKFEIGGTIVERPQSPKNDAPRDTT